VRATTGTLESARFAGFFHVDHHALHHDRPGKSISDPFHVGRGFRLQDDWETV
jgi:hypothetical protein